MRRTLLLALLTVLQSDIFAQSPQYSRTDSLRVCQLLDEAVNMSATTNYMLYFARMLTGIPYVGQTLEHNKTEQLVVNLRELDCTTYVETVAALTLCAKNGCRTFSDYCYYLQQLRYRDGIVSYPTRLHYFTEWILDNENKNLVEEMKGGNAFTEKQTVNVGFMSNNPDKYPMLAGHPEWIRDIAGTERYLNGRVFRYIPKGRILNTLALRQSVRDGDIIAIVTNKQGLDISHVGIAVWHDDGLHLLNASSIHKKTIEEPMTMKTYMGRHPSQLGIRVVKVK